MEREQREREERNEAAAALSALARLLAHAAARQAYAETDAASKDPVEPEDEQ